MTEDDFADWRDSDITREFMKWIESTVPQCEAAWGVLLNGGGGDLEMQRARLSERARVATEIINVSYEDLDDEQHERDHSHGVQGSNSA